MIYSNHGYSNDSYDTERKNMKKNLFEMGAKFDDGWSSDNKATSKSKAVEVKEPCKHNLVFAKEKRRGKVVTVIKGFYLQDSELKKLLKELKASLGCGGTIKGNTIELQGEVYSKAKDDLIKRGFRVKN
jgi:translation initiation factor 1